MSKFFLSFLLALPCFGAITDIRVTDATNIEFVVRYTAPTPAACTIEVSESATYAPLVNDVRADLFGATANYDSRNGAQGRERVFVIGSAGTGARYATIDANGRSTSRALQTNTDHYGRITCGSDTATFVARTANIAVGDTFPGTPMPIDPARLGDVGWPAVPWNGTAGVIDPVTGVMIYRFRNMNEQFRDSPEVSFNYVWDDASAWTNKTNVLATDAAVATVSTSDPLRVYANYVFDVSHYSMLGIMVRIKGYRDASGTTTEACLSIDGLTCYGPWKAFTLPIGALGSTVDVGDSYPSPDVSSAAPMFGGWLNANQKLPTQFDTSVRYGQASNVGAVLTLYTTGGGGGAFDRRWAGGTHILYNGVDYTVSSVTSATELTLNTAPPSNYTGASYIASNFGFMVRRSSGTGTVSIDSIVMYPLRYGTYNTNNGSGSIVPCTERTIPQGWRIGEPNGGSGHNFNAAFGTPVKVVTTSAIAVGALSVGDTVKTRDIPGNLGANGTFVVGAIDRTTYPGTGAIVTLTGSTTTGTFPSDATGGPPNGFPIYYGGGGLMWKPDSPKGRLCFLIDGEGTQNTYWMNDAVEPPDIRYQGLMTAGNYDFSLDPDGFPSIVKFNQATVPQELIRGRFIGNAEYGLFQDNGTNTGSGSVGGAAKAQFVYTSITPSPNTFTAKVVAFDPTMSGVAFALYGGVKGGKVTFVGGTGAQQNGLGIMGMYDPVANDAVALMNTWGNSNARWCGLHTYLPWPEADYVQWEPYELQGDNSSQTGPTNLYNGPYQLISASGTMNNAVSPTAGADIGDCATKLSAIGQANPLNVLGNKCTTVNVTSAIPITPATALPASDTRNNNGIRVGDYMTVRNATGGVLNSGSWNSPGAPAPGERVRIVGISGTTLVVQRGVGEGAAIINQGSGFKLNMFCDTTPRWWDWQNAPHGETGTDPYSQNLNGNFIDGPLQGGSHMFGRGPIFVNDSNGVTPGYLTPPFTCSGIASSAYYAFRNYPWPNHVFAPTSAYGCVKGNAEFDGVFGNGQGQYLEKHPSSVPGIVGNGASFTDSRPYLTYWTWQQTVVKVVGATYIWKVTGFNEQTSFFDEKRNKLYVSLGQHTAYDVSAAGFTLPDTAPYNYTYCYTHVAGECWTGSSVGEVYVNTPSVAKQPLGLPAEQLSGTYRCLSKGQPFSDTTMDDICVAIQSTYADTTVQYPLIHDPYNTGARILTSALGAPRTTNGLWSSPNIPGGGYQVNWNMVSNGANRMSMLVKLPPYPGPQRGINRGSFIPIPKKITSVPRGTTAAYVRFGYSPSMFCSTRQERCVANGAGIQSGSSVYSYETSDAPAGLSCSSGCTITIPALSQRMMWSQAIYLNGSTVIATGPVEVQAAP